MNIPLGKKVAVFRQHAIVYPINPPFHPSLRYPEYHYKDILLDKSNKVYEAVRDTFRLLELDREQINTPQWNPLGELIKPGDRVLIKPNLVRHYNSLGHNLDSLVTHASVVRVVLDYVIIALRAEGAICIGDASLQTCNFGLLIQETGLDKVVEYCAQNSKIKITIADFRLEQAIKDRFGIVRSRIKLLNNNHHQAVDLKKSSYLSEIDHEFHKFRVTNYDPAEIFRHHNSYRHEYLISKQVLEADVVINLPKLKTHRKAGLSVALKNMVGINGHKAWLPHHSVGSISESGDEYQYASLRKRLLGKLLDRIEASSLLYKKKLYRMIYRALRATKRFKPFQDDYFEGSWYGNDTLWRTILDINRILFFADTQGRVDLNLPQRKCFTLVDGIVAGEGEGPLEPTPRRCGVLVAGLNPVNVDTCCAMLMGFEPSQIPTISHAWRDAYLGFDLEWRLISNFWQDNEDLRENHFNFIPSQGWRALLRSDQINHEK